MTAQTEAELLQYAATFPPMPRGATQLATVTTSEDDLFTTSAGSPASDLEWCVFDSDYMDGETDGYDTFYPVDPSEDFPGQDRVKIVETVSQLQTSETYGGANGSRIVLGIAEKPFPFFYRGDDGIDNDYYVIQHFDYRNGHIQLSGEASDYRLVQASAADGVRTPGWYLFYTADGEIDLIAFIHNCDDPAADQPAQLAAAFCNAGRQLSLTNPVQFRFATPVSATPEFPIAVGAQIGGAGKEVISGSCTDPSGNVFVFGLTDSDLDPTSVKVRNEFFVAKMNEDGTVAWTTEFPASESSLIFDATADDDYVYAAGRTFGNLPGFTNAGRWDGIILKIDNQTGEVVDWTQFGTSVIDGFGNITLDDAGNLFVSGAGAPQVLMGIGDPYFLVAKFDAATLDLIWESPETVLPNTQRAAESWGGITYLPGATPGNGKLLLGGWFIDNTAGPVGAQGFLALYDQLGGNGPRRIETATIGSPGFRADWVWGSTADADGNIYAAGYTTGNLAGAPGGEGDAFIVKYNPDLGNPRFVQIGSDKSERFRSIEIDDLGNIFVSGHTYGDLAGTNLDDSGLTADVVIYKFDSDLQELERRQFGTDREERGFLSLFADRVYVGGMTEGSMRDGNLGSFDAFIVTLSTDDLTTVEDITLNIGEEVSLNDEEDPVATPLKAFPNPSSGAYQLGAFPYRIATLEAISFTGTAARRFSGFDLTNFDLSGLTPGIYQIKATTDRGKVFFTKVMLR
ncbi:hypothetical protein A3850_018530 [Lewinella sp. 4G2]|nr:hypothetical protein A3850_018530 [Lewinella sp. 4G2]